MAGNKGTIDEIVDPAAFAQLEKFIGLLVNSRGELVAAAKSAREFNDTVGSAKTVKEFEQATAKSNKALADMAASADKAALAALNLEQKKQKIADDTAKRLAKEQALENAKTKTIVSNSAQEVKAYEDSKKSIAGLTTVVNESDKAQASAANSAVAMAGAQENLSTSTQEASSAISEEKKELTDVEKIVAQTNGTLDQNIKRNIALNLELRSVSDQQKELKKSYQDGNITQDQYIQKSAALEKQQLELKTAIQQNNTVIRQNVKEQSAASTSTDSNKAKLAQLRTAYDALTDSEKKNTLVGGALLKNIKELDAAVKSSNESTGRFQDNVGNYGKALDGLPGPIGNAIGSFKQLYVTLLANPIGIVAGALFGLYQILKQNDDASNVIAGVWRGLGVIFQKVGDILVKGIGAAFEFIGDAADFVSDKFSLLIDGGKLLVSTYDKILSYVPGYEELKNAIAGTADETIRITKATIEYDKAIDDVEAKQKDLSLAISENNIELQRANNIYQDSNKTLGVRLKALDQVSSIERKSLAGKLDLLNKEEAAERRLNKVLVAGSVDREASDFRIIELQIKKNEAILEQEQLEGTIIKRRSRLIREVNKEEEDRNKKLADDAFALAKQRLEIQRDYFKAIESDETQSLDVRIAAMQAFTQRELDILKLTYEKEIKEQGLSNDKKTALKEKYDNDTAKANADLLSKINNENLKAYRDAEADYDKYLESIQQRRVQSDKDTLFRIEAERDNALASIVGNSQEAVNKRIAIEKQFTLAFIDEQIKQAEAAIQYQGATAEEEARLAALRRKRNEIASTDFEKGLQTNIQKINKFLQTTSGVISETFNLLSSLSNSYYQQQIDDISKTQERTDKKYEKEKENIENSTLTESEKKVKLALLDKQKAAQDEKLAEQKKQADIAKAKRDRAIQIGQIIANTAIAVLSQLSIPGAGFGLAAAAAAVGALQLATVLATPLPSYEKGGTKQGDGLARVSEKGPELQIDPSGKVSLTPESESIIYAKHGTKFISAPETKRILANQTLSHHFQSASNLDFDVSKLIRSGERNTDKLTRSLSRKPEPYMFKVGNKTIYKTR